MTLKAISANGARYALNEITGQLVQLNLGSPDRYNVLIPGDTSPTAMCSLLFDESRISENWSPISNCEAANRINSYSGTLCGCITVNRL